jgi:uncharacterized protein (TIGR02246 family)
MISRKKREVEMKEEIDAIEKIEAEIDRASIAGDVEEILAHIAADAVYMQPNGPSVTGKDAIRAWTSTMFDQFTFYCEHSPAKIEIVADWAIVPGMGKGSVTPKSGGDPMPFNNKYLHIYRKHPDGSWKLSQSIWNSNDPLPG